MNRFKTFVTLLKIKNFIEGVIGLKIQAKKKYPFMTRSIPEYRYVKIIDHFFSLGALNIVEVGAHEGAVITNIVKKIRNNNFLIHAIEPNSDALEICRNKFPKEKRIKFYQLALGKINEKMELNITRSSNLSSFLEPD